MPVITGWGRVKPVPALPMIIMTVLSSGMSTGGVVSGYFNDAKNTGQPFENGWFKTDDIGEIDDEAMCA